MSNKIKNEIVDLSEVVLNLFLKLRHHSELEYIFADLGRDGEPHRVTIFGNLMSRSCRNKIIKVAYSLMNTPSTYFDLRIIDRKNNRPEDYITPNIFDSGYDISYRLNYLFSRYRD